jgi:hypothetical protein
MVEFVAIAFGGAFAILLMGKYIEAPLKDYQQPESSSGEISNSKDDLIEKMSRGEIDIDEIVRKSKDKSQVKLRKEFVSQARS